MIWTYREVSLTMKLAVVLICTLAIICRALSAPQLRADEDVEVDKKESDFVLTKALPCDPELCKAPACRCSSTVLDSSIPVEQTAQVGVYGFVGGDKLFQITQIY